jgi:hypothetical protein
MKMTYFEQIFLFFFLFLVFYKFMLIFALLKNSFTKIH